MPTASAGLAAGIPDPLHFGCEGSGTAARLGCSLKLDHRVITRMIIVYLNYNQNIATN